MTLIRSERRAWDWFAAAAVGILVAHDHGCHEDVAEDSALYADAMIEERRKRMPTPGEYELIAVTPHKGQPR